MRRCKEERHGENVGGPGATITVSPNITVEWRNVGNFEAASIVGNGPSYTAPTFSQTFSVYPSGTRTVYWCNNGWNAAGVIINASSVSVNNVSLNGGHGQNAATGSGTCAGNGGHAGKFTVVATGNINIDSISVLPGNGGHAGGPEATNTVGHSGNPGHVSLGGANLGGKTSSRISILGRGGNGGNERCRSTSIGPSGYQCNYGNQGRGSRGASVYISSPGIVNINSISIPGGPSGSGNQQWNSGRSFYQQGGNVLVGFSPSADSQSNPLSVDITSIDASTPGNSQSNVDQTVSINGTNIKFGTISMNGASPYLNLNRMKLVVTGSGNVDFASIGMTGGFYDTAGQAISVCGGRGGAASVSALGKITGGSIVANGGNSNFWCGGGPGGSIALKSPDTTIGSISARGSDGGGGGGAGGTLRIEGNKALVTGTVNLIGGNELSPSGSFRHGGKGGTADFRGVADVSVNGGVDLRSGITSFQNREGQIMLRTNFQGTTRGGVVSSQYTPSSVSPAVCVVAVPSG